VKFALAHGRDEEGTHFLALAVLVGGQAVAWVALNDEEIAARGLFEVLRIGRRRLKAALYKAPASTAAFFVAPKTALRPTLQ
jgi:hypothetical protein